MGVGVGVRVRVRVWLHVRGGCECAGAFSDACMSHSAGTVLSVPSVGWQRRGEGWEGAGFWLLGVQMCRRGRRSEIEESGLSAVDCSCFL